MIVSLQLLLMKELLRKLGRLLMTAFLMLDAIAGHLKTGRLYLLQLFVSLVSDLPETTSLYFSSDLLSKKLLIDLYYFYWVSCLFRYKYTLSLSSSRVHLVIFTFGFEVHKLVIIVFFFSLLLI